METITTDTQQDDEVLVAALRARDENSLTEVSKRYRGVLIGVIMKVTHDPIESEDVFQEVLL
ncbi:MAG: RNA polymerase sigma factor, partial [Chthoniobacterales bacterium]